MEKEMIDKIMEIFDLEFDALFYSYMVKENEIQEIYAGIRKRLEEL